MNQVSEARQIIRRTVRMPEVVGIRLDNARLMLRNADFELEQVRIRYEEAYRPEDDVIRQSPAPGALVSADDEVELVVSRRSLLHHLPQCFQKADRDGDHFLREFLWIFNHIQADLERKIDGLHRFFDPLNAPPEFLPWLAGWVALSIEQDWPEVKKRKLIREAIGIYSYRGTGRGLKLFLSIFTGVEPRVLENRWPYKGFRIGLVRMGVDSVVLPPVNLAHCAMIEVPAEFTDATDETILKIHDIIRMEKPGHVAYFLTFASAPSQDPLEAFRIGVGRMGVSGDGVVAGMTLADERAE